MKKTACPKCQTVIRFDPNDPQITCAGCGKTFVRGQRSKSSPNVAAASASSGFDDLDAALASQPTDVIARSRQRAARKTTKQARATPKSKVKLVTPQRKINEMSAKPKGAAKYLPLVIAAFVLCCVGIFGLFFYLGPMNKPKKKEVKPSAALEMIRMGLNPMHVGPRGGDHDEELEDIPLDQGDLDDEDRDANDGTPPLD